MQRPLVSYADDIPLPYDDPEPVASASASPSKKRKWSNQKAPTATVKQEDRELEEGEEEEDSRVLTAEEIWDDSALIDAWDAAMEEYEALNGPDKGWKNEPVHKSPLWYNVPANKPPKKKLKKSMVELEDATTEENGADDSDSRPIDFATFVPTYDASLALPVPDETGGYSLTVPGPSMPSQDEAFQRALGAMYWGGYWTAVYHVCAVLFVSLESSGISF
ncbi:hypothetical protein C8F01DRAFT_1147360 [Mycena amicta]|nr:hypothetical protein C8F01DRAFT_1147360 [Mycena amicta]